LPLTVEIVRFYNAISPLPKSRMKTPRNLIILLTLGLSLLSNRETNAATSPYVTQETNVPLNQSTNDSINGILPYFVSHAAVEGTASSLIDAVTPDTPTDNVILGPDNTWIGVTWDFGEPNSGYIWRLDRVDEWIAGGDNLRKGIRADLSVSITGEINDFTVISNSLHWDALQQNDQFNHLRYDFPDQFIAGPTNTMDRYPVKGFRYLRLNSRGDKINGVDWQTRFVEFDVWVSQVLSPDTPVINSVTRNQSGDVTFKWNAITGRTYVVDYKTNLIQPEWISLDPFVADSETASVTNNTAGFSQRFYRVVLKP
jgi:hypothetical protein